MNKIYSLVIVSLLLHVCQAQQLLKTDFSTFNLGSLHGQNFWSNSTGAVGGGGANCFAPVSSCFAQIVSQNMSYPSFGSSTKALNYTHSRDYVGKGIVPSQNTDGSSVYFAIMLRMTSLTYDNAQIIRIGKIGNPTNVYDFLLSIKRAGAGFYAGLGLYNTSNPTYFYNETNPSYVAFGTDNLIVIKYNYFSGADSLKLYVNPSLSSTEPSNPEIAVSTITTANTAKLDRIQTPMYLTNQINGFIGGITASNSWGTNLVLPNAKIKNFTANSLTNNLANLIWDLDNFSELQKVEVEYSNNATQFSVQHTINYPNKNNYIVSVSTPASLNYFRLKLTDKNGMVTYSNTLTINKNNSAAITPIIYPNPVKNKAQIKLLVTETGKHTLQIVDLAGRVLLQKEQHFNSGANNFTLETSQLKSGNYILKINKPNGSSVVQKLVKE